MSQSQIVLIAHNVRSAHNVGSILRTADGLGVEKIYLTGYTPYPASKNDGRMPHERQKTHKSIAKTSLGAEQSVEWLHNASLEDVIGELRAQGYQMAALEQAKGSIELSAYGAPAKVALVVGSELGGLEQHITQMCDLSLEIPMLGTKESYNVAVAAAMALYQIRFYDKNRWTSLRTKR